MTEFQIQAARLAALIPNGELLAQTDQAEFLRAVAAEIERLRAIEDWLPKDSEGNAVYPGRELVSTYYGDIQQPRMVTQIWRDGWTLGSSSKYMANDPGRQCYGSVEAAEKARQP